MVVRQLRRKWPRSLHVNSKRPARNLTIDRSAGRLSCRLRAAGCCSLAFRYEDRTIDSRALQWQMCASSTPNTSSRTAVIAVSCARVKRPTDGASASSPARRGCPHVRGLLAAGTIAAVAGTIAAVATYGAHPALSRETRASSPAAGEHRPRTSSPARPPPRR